jgi:diaminopimelate decarboxylase
VQAGEHLRYAREAEVRLMTADNVEERRKIRDIFPEAHIVLRIAVGDSKSVCRCNSNVRRAAGGMGCVSQHRQGACA